MKFGTDGVRGVANTELTAEFSLRLGRAAARVLAGGTHTVVVGGDTRASTPMLDAALSAGFAAEGVDVLRLGVVPTPMVAFVAQRLGAMGAMVSASHNPYADNGIKLFAAGGTKLSDDVESAIERELELLQPPVGEPVRIGSIDQSYTAAYVDHIAALAPDGAAGALRIVVDAANGAAHGLVRRVFERLGAEVIVIGDAPTGTNINDACGATAPGALATAVRDHRADLGIALDGDADRLIAVDHAGTIVDGDHIIAICALDMRNRGTLHHDTVAVTTMTNLGFHLAMRSAGIDVVTTDVGDRYVLEALGEHGLALGGEQSGHVIFADHGTTGDGMLTGVVLVDIVARSGRSLADLAASAMTSLPQVLVNVEVAERVPDAAALLADEVAKAEHELGEDGRVLVRASGTEPLVRVMVEAPTAGMANAVADGLAEVVRRRLPREACRPNGVDSLGAMCGIIGVVSRPPTRPVPTAAEIIGGLDAAVAARPDLVACATAVGTVDALLRGLPGAIALTSHVDTVASITARLDQLDAFAAEVEVRLDGNDPVGGGLDPEQLEAANAQLIGLKDVLWAIRDDRLRMAQQWAGSPGVTPRRTPWLVICRSSRRSHPSIGSRCAVVIGGTARLRLGSRHRSRRARRDDRRAGHRPLVPVPHGHRRQRRAVVRLQGGCGDR